MKCLRRHEWIALQRRLLDKEREAEVISQKLANSKLLEEQGLALTGLTVCEKATGLYGHPLVTLSNHTRSALPTNSLSVGDIIGLHGSIGDSRVDLSSGVITQVTRSLLQVSIDSGNEGVIEDIEDCCNISLQKLCSDVTYEKIKDGLRAVEVLEGGPVSHIFDVIFGEADLYNPVPTLPPVTSGADGQLKPYNNHLTESQIESVDFCVRCKDVGIIHGPPGTGKTTTLIEVIQQHVKLRNKVLACAPSNIAVDNLVEHLAAAKLRIVRLGHPARVTKMTQSHTLDALIYHSDQSIIIEDIHKDITKNLMDIKKTRDFNAKRKIRSEIKHFRKELKERQTKMTKDILSQCDVVLSTLTTSSKDGPLRLLPPDHFSLVVIDECAQSIESACYLPIIRAPKVILAGDHCQLPPTVISEEASKEGLLYSLMERLIENYGDKIMRMLKVQFRMNSLIMNWASEALYKKELVAHSSVESHKLSDLPYVQSTEDTESVLILIDTSGCGLEEINTTEEQSKGNEGEAIIAAAHIKALLKAGVRQEDIAVITPYNLQVDLIRGLLGEAHPDVEVRSVDGFQGREKEAIVMSLVRSNKKGDIGFLSEDRRLNVAVTRARRHLTVICDSQTVGKHDFLKAFINYLSDSGSVRSAYEYQHELDSTDVKMPESRKHFLSLSNKEKVHKGPKSKSIKSALTKANTSDKEGLSRNSVSSPVKNMSTIAREIVDERDAADEDPNEMKKLEFEQRLLWFAKSEDCEMSFPSYLTSYERMLIHTFAERLSLNHVSTGEGTKRAITVSKKDTKVSASPNAVSVPQSQVSLSEGHLLTAQGQESVSQGQMLVSHGRVTQSLPQCSASIRKAEAIPSESDHFSSLPEDCRNVPALKIKKKKEHEKGGPSRKMRNDKALPNKRKEESEDFDEIIALFKKVDNTCSFSRCKTQTSLIYQQCLFCKKTFCLSHHMPEVHGCGDEARKHARHMFVKDGILGPSSKKQLNPTKRAQLQRKLDKKVEELSDQRKSKASKN